MPRLISISFREPPSLPGIRAAGIATIDVPPRHGPLMGFHFAVHGPTLLITSPPGWTSSEHGEKPEGCTMFEVPRSAASLKWALDAGQTPEAIREWSMPQPRSVEPAVARELFRDPEPGTLDPVSFVVDDNDRGDDPIVRTGTRPPKVTAPRARQ